jgi:hypothetical protein
LVFGSSAFVALKVTYPDMQPSMRLADEPNPGAIRHNYFLPRPSISGRYKLVPIAAQKIAKMDAFIVEIDVIKEGCKFLEP